MQVSNFLFQGLDFKDFEIQDFLYTASNISCDIAWAVNIRTHQKFLVKILGLSTTEKDCFLHKELALLDMLNLHPFKPKCLPLYYGYAKQEEKDKGNVYNVVYEHLELNLKKLIKTKLVKHEIFPFEFILDCFNSLANSLAFLQNQNICPSRFDCDKLFIHSQQKIPKIIDLCPESEFFVEAKRHAPRDLIYLPPEVSDFFQKERDEEKRKLSPYKVLAFSFGIIILELLTFQTPANVQSFSKEIPRLLSLASERYSGIKESFSFKMLLKILNEILTLEYEERIDCRQLFWKNAEMRNLTVSNHLMQHIFIEDGNCSELKLFNELKIKGKPFDLRDSVNTNDEIFGSGQQSIDKEFTDKNSLKALLSSVKPLRAINVKTLRGNIDKNCRFYDDCILGKEFWDLENFPVKSIILECNVHEKLVDDEYKKYYYNLFTKPGIKSTENCEEGCVKILHQHNENFMEGVHDEQMEPVLESLRENFVKGNRKLEKLCIMLQR